MSDSIRVESLELTDKMGRRRDGGGPEESHEVNSGARKVESVSITGVSEVEVDANENTFSTN